MTVEHMRCQHLRHGTLAKHADMTLEAVPPGENTTSYSWHVSVELCVLCSGYIRGTLATDPVRAE